MKWPKIFAVLGALAAGLYLYYQWAFPVYSYRFRVTIEVDDNGKVYSGSGIIQSSWQNAPNWVPVEKHWTGWHTGRGTVCRFRRQRDFGRCISALET